MPLHLLIGPAASGKTTKIFDRVKDVAASDPTRSVIYITPEQASLKAEQALLERIPSHSLLGIQVLSFKRLAYTVFDEIGLEPDAYLDDVGKSMVLQLIAKQHEKELLYFQRSVGQRGFIDQLKKMITEIIQYQLSDEQLEKLQSTLSTKSVFFQKIHDIRLLYKAFLEYTEGKEHPLLPAEALLDRLALHMGESELIRDSEIFVDGFDGFTPQQYRLLEGFLNNSKKLTVTLTLPKDAYNDAFSQGDQWQKLRMNVFFSAQKTLLKLNDMSKRLQQKTSTEFVEEDTRPSEIRYVNEKLCLYEKKAFDSPAEHVMAYAAKTQTDELQQVFRNILKLIREEGYALRDITLVTADLNGYAHAIKRFSELYSIPIFIDEKMQVSLSPFVQWLEAAIGLITSGFSLHYFLMMVKTGLTDLSRDTVDRLENRALSENWIGIKRMTNGLIRLSEEIKASSEQEEAVKDPETGDLLRQLAEQLQAFHDAAGSKKTVGEYEKALTELMESQHIREHLLDMAKELDEDNDLLLAAQNRRIYDQIMEVRQQLEEVLGDMRVNFKEYASILKIGIDQCRMGQLPPTMDEVMVAELSRSGVVSSKAVFFLGMHGSSFPMVSDGGGLLSDQERQVAGETLEVAGNSRQDLMQQYYRLYQDMGKAREKLFFFCSMHDLDGELRGASPIWKRLENTLGEGWRMNELSNLTLPVPLLFEGTGEPNGTSLQWLQEHGYEDQVSLIKHGETIVDQQKHLSGEVARLIDPSRKTMSFTGLQCYVHCPYEYYLRYGLHLKERKTSEITLGDTGTLLHDLLSSSKRFLDKNLTEEEAKQLSQELMEKKVEEYPLYQTTARFRYFWKKLEKLVGRNMEILSGQAHRSSFTDHHLEWPFGQNLDPTAVFDQGEAIEIRMTNGKKIRLQGRIDRIDIWDDEEERYIQIIDYKSGKTDYKLGEVKCGLQLQLPVYMEAAAKHFKGKPAGFFYFHLTPLMDDPKKTQPVGLSDEEKRMFQQTLDGAYLYSPEMVRELDHSFDSGKQLVVKASRTATGNLRKTERAFDAEGYEEIVDTVYTRIREIADKMAEGCVRRMPMEQGQEEGDTHCTFCEYRSGCPYDKRTPMTSFKRIEPKFYERGYEKLIFEESDYHFISPFRNDKSITTTLPIPPNKPKKEASDEHS